MREARRGEIKMKTKETFYYIPTFGSHTTKVFAGTIPGQHGVHEIENTRYFIGFLDNIWRIKDRDVNPYILPLLLLATIIAGIIFF